MTYNIYLVNDFEVDYDYRIKNVFNKGDAIVIAGSRAEVRSLLEEKLSTPGAKEAGLKEFDLRFPKGIINTGISADTKGVIYTRIGPRSVSFVDS